MCMCEEHCVQELTVLRGHGGGGVGGGSPAFRVTKVVSCSTWSVGTELQSTARGFYALKHCAHLSSTQVSFLSERKGSYMSCIHSHITYSASLHES